MFNFVLLNSIFILFPILCYLLYMVYENMIGRKCDALLFDFAIISSVYLITKYSTNYGDITDVVNILLLICMVKNKKNASIIISIYLSIYLGVHNGYNTILIMFKYIIQLSLFLVFLKDMNFKYRIVIFTIVSIICGISFGYLPIGYIIISNILYSFLGYILIEMINRLEKIIGVYGTFRKVEYEKNVRESLFNITHEIKNPIAVCKGYLDMLDTNDIKKVNKYIPIINEEINRTLTLMNDFLNLTKLKVNRCLMDISLLLDDVSEEIDTLLCDSNINYIYDVTDEEVYIEGDYDRLKQVFINLIKNSIESIEDNKIGLIELKMVVKKDILITIKDNGVGISKEALKRIGEPFFTTKSKGTGLGVKLSTEIIELHNGKIKYFSKENEGTVVKIKLKKIEN